MSDAADAGWPDIAGRIEDKSHVLAVRVYYEDTDFSGRVYHANYLKFCERGRSDMLRLAGIHHHELAGGEGASGLARQHRACPYRARPAGGAWRRGAVHRQGDGGDGGPRGPAATASRCSQGGPGIAPERGLKTAPRN